MKKCPTCGELTNSKFCPECGTNLADVEELISNGDEAASIIEEEVEKTNDSADVANKNLNQSISESQDDLYEKNDSEESETTNNAQIDKPKTEPNAEVLAAQDNNDSKVKAKSKKKIIAIAVIGLVIIAGLAFFGIKSARDKAAQEAYDNTLLFLRTNSGMMQLDVVSNPIITLAEPDKINCCEQLMNMTNNVWHDSIFEEYDEDTNKYIKGTSDFNEALANLYQAADVVEFNERLKQHLDMAKNNLLLGDNPVPESLKAANDAYTKVVIAYQALVDWCDWPNASYSTYMEKSQELYDNFNNAYNEFDMICPQWESPEESESTEGTTGAEDSNE